jgi:predicted transcriptional regulator
MYETNTSYTSFTKRLSQLQNLGLLQQEKENKYITTERGKKFLQKYNELQQFLIENKT